MSKANTALVSIIIPAFNRATLIGETLDSILAQTYTNWECIIVDDGSTDNTVETIEMYCKKDKRLQLVRRNREPKGAPTCRNIGLSNAKGEYINFFDSDDIMHKDFLSIKLQAIKDYNVDFVVCQASMFFGSFNDSTQSCKESIHPIESKQPFVDHLTGKITFYTPGPLWKRKLLTNNLFEETDKLFQEWSAYNKILIENINYKAINIPLFHYRQHDNSIKKNLNDFSNDRIFNLIQIRKRNFLLAKSKFHINKQVSHFFLNDARALLLLSSQRKNIPLQLKILIFIALIAKNNKRILPTFIKFIIGSFTITFFNKGYKLLTIKPCETSD